MREIAMSTLNYDVSFDIKHIDDISTYKGFIPSGYDLIEYEKDTDPVEGTVLYGFDEIGLAVSWGEVKNPAYAFIKANF
jgi:hypothetical protein